MVRARLPVVVTCCSCRFHFALTCRWWCGGRALPRVPRGWWCWCWRTLTFAAAAPLPQRCCGVVTFCRSGVGGVACRVGHVRCWCWTIVADLPPPAARWCGRAATFLYHLIPATCVAYDRTFSRYLPCPSLPLFCLYSYTVLLWSFSSPPPACSCRRHARCSCCRMVLMLPPRPSCRCPFPPDNFPSYAATCFLFFSYLPPACTPPPACTLPYTFYRCSPPTGRRPPLAVLLPAGCCMRC